MSADTEGAIMALDGAINTVSSLQRLAEVLDADESIQQGLYGVLAAVGSARILVARFDEAAEQQAGAPCIHPEAARKSRVTGGGKVEWCDACGEFLVSTAA